MTVVAALPLQNLHIVESEIADRSNPKRYAGSSSRLLPVCGEAASKYCPPAALQCSPNFRKWFTIPQVTALTQPAQAVRSAVINWFNEGGADCVSVHAMLRCTATVAVVRCRRLTSPFAQFCRESIAHILAD